MTREQELEAALTALRERGEALVKAVLALCVFWPGDREHDGGTEVCWCSEIEHDEDCAALRAALRE